jgi:uncharacterized DUF497 family protein
MNDGPFLWDDAKAATNCASHGVTFEAARDGDTTKKHAMTGAAPTR